MEQAAKERRKYTRYQTRVDVYFDVTYDVKTKVRFQLFDKIKKKILTRKYQALSRNVSVEGLSFISSKELLSGDLLHLEVYLPGQKQPVPMEGEVMWSQSINPFTKEKDQFETGVRIYKVDRQPVRETLFHDESYHITWSIVLESILGNFRKFIQEKKSS